MTTTMRVGPATALIHTGERPRPAAPLTTPIYRCPACEGLLAVEHDTEALRDRSASAWISMVSTPYSRL